MGRVSRAKFAHSVMNFPRKIETTPGRMPRILTKTIASNHVSGQKAKCKHASIDSLLELFMSEISSQDYSTTST